MIIELLLSPLFLLVSFIVSLLGYGGSLPSWSIDFMNMIQVALTYFPSDVFCTVIVNIYLWVVALLSWSVIEWVYKKIPGVN